MATVTAPVVETPRKPFRFGPLIIVIGTAVLLIFAFIELAPFVLTIANSFKCQASVQNAVGAIIPVPPANPAQATPFVRCCRADFIPSPPTPPPRAAC